MLGKLIKYEFKCCGRIFIPLYIGILVISSINGLCNMSTIDKSNFTINTYESSINIFLFFILFVLLIALFVMTIVVAIQRFKNNLLKDEGYLMFTLPVNSEQLVFSKYIVSVIFFILSNIVSILGFFFIGIFSGNLNSYNWTLLINQITSHSNYLEVFFISSISFIVIYSIVILDIYLAMSVAQLPLFSKHKVIVALIVFFVVNTIINYIQKLIPNNIIETNPLLTIRENILISLSVNDFLELILSILIAILLFISTNWILNNKLNLD